MDDQIQKIMDEIEQMPSMIKTAIAKYTLSVEINRKLRGSTPLDSEFQEMLDNIDLAFSLVTPLEQDIIVYRGVSNTQTFYPSDLGFVSTAIDPAIAKPFIGSGCCLLLIRIRAGSRVLRIPKSIGVYKDESEVLLYRGARFSKLDEGYLRPDFPGIKVFELEYVPAPVEQKNPQLIYELRQYMDMNAVFFNFLDRNDLIGFNEFINLKNCDLMFRCMFGDIFIKPELKSFFEVIISKFPHVTTQIPKLADYLNGFSLVEEKVERIFEFNFDLLTQWRRDSINRKRDMSLFISACQKGIIYPGFFKPTTDIHEKDDLALRLASKNGHISVVKFLIEKGALINSEDDESLRLAASNGHFEVVNLLISNGANIHAKHDQALRFAAANGHLEMVQLLLSNGADKTTLDNEAARLAAKNGHLEILKMLV